MVRTKPDSEHHQNDLKDDETIIPPLCVMVKTKPKIKHHEDKIPKQVIKANLPKAKDKTSMIPNRSCHTLAIQNKHIETSQPSQLKRKQPTPHG
ncbi:hypothetical protein O181_125355 [Austropuccinia psidii MF-1]|uniref:Uncharacterized protein n=1 Tax=Austropuccinia psidii MF-1 TaxID=1389203 RepID=A0A9Q3KUQ1_9BASI|nr:hypothetical protein [Austropuccinia psidii MF-1]